MNTANTTFKSRWGFHPCNYELFLKLRRLHKWYWQTLYDFHRWHRWWRKEEQNRIGPEPSCCPAFVEDKTWRKSVRIHGEDGFKVYPNTVVDHGMVGLYQSAATMVEVRRLVSPDHLVEIEVDAVVTGQPTEGG